MRIEYEDKDIIVVYKEAGLPVQTGRTSKKDLVSLLKNHLAKEEQAVSGETGADRNPRALSRAGEDKTQSVSGRAGQGRKYQAAPGAGLAQTKNREPYLGIIHRLDQPVEGLLVFAKTPKSASFLSARVASKDEMEKVYRTVVSLCPESYLLAIEGRKRDIELTDWLRRDFSTNTAIVAKEGEKDAKCAKLTFRTLEIRNGKAYLEVRLLTGRHHQIRAQLAHAGMPILGDRKYGSNHTTGLYDENRRLCLCAYRLSFPHPSGGKMMTFETEPTFGSVISEERPSKD